jgi:hypothetical protein
MLTWGSQFDPLWHMKTGSKRITTLSAEENHAWEFAFALYVNEGHPDSKADQFAWRDIVLEFPRLKEFSGCR